MLFQREVRCDLSDGWNKFIAMAGTRREQDEVFVIRHAPHDKAVSRRQCETAFSCFDGCLIHARQAVGQACGQQIKIFGVHTARSNVLQPTLATVIIKAGLQALAAVRRENIEAVC